jgi:hypothetical protein
MRKKLLFAVGLAMILLFIANIQHAKADVYAQFSSVSLIRGVSYQELDSKKDNLLPAIQFALPPNYFYGTGYDDGYAYIAFPSDFIYSYDDVPYNGVWVNVNGFVCFEKPNLDVIATKTSTHLFFSYSNYPKTVVAPYWGDHYYRSALDVPQGYIQSRISYQFILDSKHADSILVIQWKDLNINNSMITSSTGNFQVRFYKSYVKTSTQGDIEFCYGSIGNNTGDTVITKGASVGINGSANDWNNHSDFLNGLDFYDPTSNNILDISVSRTDDSTLTKSWTPSIYNDNRIRFIALIRQDAPESWGDGDADMSKVIGARDYGLPQNRYVTMSDVRTILRSVATQMPLDSLIGRAAYHGDVNHNGRYFYKDTVINGSIVTMKNAITWVDFAFTDHLPSGITNENQIFFQANEADASVIMDYLAARVPSLPWQYDTVPQYGKISPYEDNATGLRYGTAKKVDNGTYQIPVYLNGAINGPLSAKFEVSGELINVTAINGVLYDFSGKVVTFATTGEFTGSQVIAYLTVKSDNAIIINNARFNDKPIQSQTINIVDTETNTDLQNQLIVTEDQNGATGTIIVNPNQDGFYSLNIYDMQGKNVTSYNQNMNQGSNVFTVDNLNNGMYIVVLTGENVNISKKLLFSK